MSEINPRDFGRLEAEVCALTELMKAQTQIIKHMGDRLDLINETLTEARGGWRVLMWVGGAASTMGAMVSWALSNLTWRAP